MLRKQHAFTLIELLVTIVVLGVVIAIALPSFNKQILNNRAAGLGEDFLSALSFVRSEAVKQGRSGQIGGAAKFIVLCAASADSKSCSSTASDWTNGFIAVLDFAPTESTAAPVLSNNTNPNIIILKVWPKQDINAEISVTQFTGGAAISFIRYTSLGKLAVTTPAPDAINIKTKMKDNGVCLLNSARYMQVGIVGIARLIDKNCW